ncbi:UNVERIFIED_CONTAM: Retrovirus-related Pol polyprotein from transposon RE2 [Sesamum latifolium]|uniref:Retrovirus-related Pol polyprotein from transposon RE2 n=1 Tax=Sesamum latifolium TaxID=2727402 RepID=A0AAW2SSE5_9LAMI
MSTANTPLVHDVPPATSPQLSTLSPTPTPTPTAPPDSISVPPPRRTNRSIHKPSWLTDYICDCASHSSSTCIPSTFTPAHISFVALLSSIQEPRTYHQATLDGRWVAAMNQELAALEQNDTWDIVNLPPDKKAIGSCWVFKLKLNPDGTIQRHKARLVAKGYNQGWPLLQIDVNNAFLHGFLDEEVYMTPPEGYTKTLPGQDAHMLEAKSAPTPLPPGFKLTSDGGSLLCDPGSYRRLVGCLLYLGFSRPDVSFVVQQLSQFLQHPRSSHWDAAMHVLRYLKGTSSLGLFFSSQNSLQLSVFTDASWASCTDTRRSITGFCIFLGSTLISWKTKKQATVSRSSTEAEYRSMGAAVSELLWISYLLRDLQIPLSLPVPFWCDNKAALHITANPVFHERTKHLDIDCHLVRDQFKLGFISPQHVPGRDQVADLFTKSLPAGDFSRLFFKLGLAPQAPS